MTTRNIPNEYNRNFILPYRTDNEINKEFISSTKEIMDIKDKTDLKQFDNPKVKYNPLYSPSDLVDYGIQHNYTNRMDNCKIKRGIN